MNSTPSNTTVHQRSSISQRKNSIAVPPVSPYTLRRRGSVLPPNSTKSPFETPKVKDPTGSRKSRRHNSLFETTDTLAPHHLASTKSVLVTSTSKSGSNSSNTQLVNHPLSYSHSVANRSSLVNTYLVVNGLSRRASNLGTSRLEGNVLEKHSRSLFDGDTRKCSFTGFNHNTVKFVGFWILADFRIKKLVFESIFLKIPECVLIFLTLLPRRSSTTFGELGNKGGSGAKLVGRDSSTAAAKGSKHGSVAELRRKLKANKNTEPPSDVTREHYKIQ